MELIEIKEILRKASIEEDIQGHGKHIALFETDFERVAIELVKKLTIPVVSNCAKVEDRPKPYEWLKVEKFNITQDEIKFIESNV